MTLVKTIEEAKAILGLEVKGNVANTQDTGTGAELAPKEEFSRSVIEEIGASSTLLSSLPGNHGSQIPASLVVPVIGEYGFFQNAPEWTDTTDSLTSNTQTTVSGQIKLENTKLIMTVNVSDELLARGVDIESYIRARIAGSAARTSESILLNADNTTGTGNINKKGATITATEASHWFRPAGLRKKALEQASLNVGALTDADLFDLVGKIGDKAANPSDCLFLTNRVTALKISQLEAFKQAYMNGRSSTLVKGMETNLLGSDVYVARDILKADATGAVSNTAGDNVTGSLLYIHKAAPQFGFTDLKIEPKRVEGYGYMFVCTMYFAHAIASNVTNTIDPSVAIGYNITL